jgi:hypothetical protein
MKSQTFELGRLLSFIAPSIGAGWVAVRASTKSPVGYCARRLLEPVTLPLIIELASTGEWLPIKKLETTLD